MDGRFAERALEGSLPPHGSRKVQMAGSLAECICSLGSGERGESVTFISSGQTLPAPSQQHPVPRAAQRSGGDGSALRTGGAGGLVGAVPGKGAFRVGKSSCDAFC